MTVVEPPADDRVLVEAGLRIRAELDAAGLSNRALTCAGGVGSESCDATASAAAIALSRQDGLATIRVIASLPDGYELHRLIRVPAAAGGDDPRCWRCARWNCCATSIWTFRATSHREPAAPPRRRRRSPSRRAATGRAPDRTPMRVFLGAAVLGGRSGLGPAIAPVLGVTLPLRYGFALAGRRPGRSRRLVGDADTGTAATTQALAMAGGRFEI